MPFRVRKAKIVVPSRRIKNLDDVNGKTVPKKKEQKVRSITKLSSKITPGTVLILLIGEHKGRRVIFLKQLSSGSLLVTGPHKINGVALEHVEQSRVIATSTKIDLPETVSKAVADIDASIFGTKEEKQKEREEKKQREKDGDKKEKKGFFDKPSTVEKKKQVNPKIKSLQGELDAHLLPVIQKVPFLENYLSSYFTLTEGQAPHLMKF